MTSRQDWLPTESVTQVCSRTEPVAGGSTTTTPAGGGAVLEFCSAIPPAIPPTPAPTAAPTGPPTMAPVTAPVATPAAVPSWAEARVGRDNRATAGAARSIWRIILSVRKLNRLANGSGPKEFRAATGKRDRHSRPEKPGAVCEGDSGFS